MIWPKYMIICSSICICTRFEIWYKKKLGSTMKNKSIFICIVEPRALLLIKSQTSHSKLCLKCILLVVMVKLQKTKWVNIFKKKKKDIHKKSDLSKIGNCQWTLKLQKRQQCLRTYRYWYTLCKHLIVPPGLFWGPFFSSF